MTIHVQLWSAVPHLGWAFNVVTWKDEADWLVLVTWPAVALAAFWKVEMFLSRCGADAPGKNERVAPRPRRFHYERAYRASTFEITNLSAQKTRYVNGPLNKHICLKSIKSSACLSRRQQEGWPRSRCTNSKTRTLRMNAEITELH